MQIQLLKSKIHRVRVTQAELDYIGSITIDETLMLAANIIENLKSEFLAIGYGNLKEKVTVTVTVIL